MATHNPTASKAKVWDYYTRANNLWQKRVITAIVWEYCYYDYYSLQWIENSIRKTDVPVPEEEKYTLFTKYPVWSGCAKLSHMRSWSQK